MSVIVQFTSTIRCPRCDGQREERMPTDACQFFYECTHCGVVLRPLAGDCCVYCSYGTVPCPPMQEAASGTRSNCCGDINAADGGEVGGESGRG